MIMSKVGVVIKGTKRGFDLIYASKEVHDTDKSAIIYDLRKDSISENVIGQQCYGISFSPNGKVCTIYRIMYDGLRSMAVGFIGISLFIPYEVGIDGKTGIYLLNNLLLGYLKYAEKDKLGAKNEDWEFIENLLDANQQNYKYVGKKNSSWISGTKDAAYIYYNEVDLEMYFDKMFQSQYKNYKQIVLIEKNLKNKTNILEAIKHSDDLTDLINFKNPSYSLIVNPIQGVEVRVQGDGGNIQNDAKIKKDQSIKIDFIKQYHDSISIAGNYQELLTKHPGILTIDENSKIIIINPPQFLTQSKTVKVNISDDSNILVKESIISLQLKNENKGKVKHNDEFKEFTFYGQEIYENWILIVDAGEQYEKLEKQIYPNSLPNSIDIKILKKKRLFPESKKAPKHWWKENKIIFLVGCFVFLVFVGIIVFVYQLVIPNSILTSTGSSEPSKTNNIDPTSKEQIDNINNYVDGMDLNLDSLNSFNKYLDGLSPTASINITKSKIINGIQIREAINRNDKNNIELAYKIIGLPKEQNELLKLICSNNFTPFYSIQNRNELSLSAIKLKLDSIILTQETTKKEKENVKFNTRQLQQTKDTLTYKDQENYSSDDFWLKVKKIKSKADLNSFDVTKMNKTQQSLFEKIKDNISPFLKIQNKEKLNAKQLEANINKL